MKAYESWILVLRYAMEVEVEVEVEVELEYFQYADLGASY